jgi:NAD(P)-dependent dehydrogenase (short-subunit alcohol dehydrogenase family)
MDLTVSLGGRKVLVVGASTGIGRSFAVRAVKAGATIAVTARRKELLAEAIEEAGGGTAIVADLQVEADCRRIAAEAADALGQIDVVVFAAGMAPLRLIEATDAADWATTMSTNVIGINLVTAALLPHLAPGALVAALSSEAVGQGRYALAAYGASKAALEASWRTWRIEHPEARFTIVAVGSTAPTDFSATFDNDLLIRGLQAWTAQGLMQADLMITDDVADVLVGLLSTLAASPAIGMEHVSLRSPSRIVGLDEPI